MTIKEAQKLVCPFISNCVASPDHAEEFLVRCLSDKCAAWKTAQDEEYINGKLLKMKREDHVGYCKRLS